MDKALQILVDAEKNFEAEKQILNDKFYITYCPYTKPFSDDENFDEIMYHRKRIENFDA